MIPCDSPYVPSFYADVFSLCFCMTTWPKSPQSTQDSERQRMQAMQWGPQKFHSKWLLTCIIKKYQEPQKMHQVKIMVLICFLIYPDWFACTFLSQMFAWSIPQVPFAFIRFYHIAGAGISWVVHHRHRRIYSHEVGASFGATAADAVGNSRLTSWAHCYPNDPFRTWDVVSLEKVWTVGGEPAGIEWNLYVFIWIYIYIYMIPMVLAHDWPARAMCGAGGAMINGHLHTRKSNVYNYYKCIVAI